MGTHPGARCCCDACRVFYDSVTRADAADPGANYTVEAGSATVVGGKIVVDTVNAAVLVAGVNPNSLIEADVTAAAGDVVRLFTGWTESLSTPSIYAEFEFAAGAGNGRVRIYYVEGDGGVRREDSATLLPGVTYRLGFCNRNAAIPAVAYIDGAVAVGSVPSTSGGGSPSPDVDAPGFGTGATVSGDVTFDNVEVGQTTTQLSATEFVNCTHCLACFWPPGPSRQIRLTISGATDDDCGDCESLDGEYVLDPVPDANPGFDPPIYTCEWRYEFPAPVCGFDEIVYQAGYTIALPGGPEFVRLEFRTATTVATYRQSAGLPAAAGHAFDAPSLTLAFNAGLTTSTACAFPATVLLEVV